MKVDPIDIFTSLKRSQPLPITLINTRDCFAFDMKVEEEKLNCGAGRENVVRKEFFFDPELEKAYPDNFVKSMGYGANTDMSKMENLRVGVVTYENFFTNEEMCELEKLIEDTEAKSL